MEDINNKTSNNTIEKMIDRIFSIKKTTLYLILIFILGFTLRLIAAINLTVSADDMHHVTHAINFFSSSRLIVYDQSAGLWHAFTSIIYKLLGMTQLSSRFAALLFGSLSILAIYLLSKEFFDEKTSLIAAFLLAIAPFHIKYTVSEMDVMTTFFILASILLFIKALKTNKSINFAISGILLGLAIYTKVYPLLFIPSLLIYLAYYEKGNKKEIVSKNNAKKILLFLFCVFIFTLPALTHNYLLYKDKGFLDLQFTRTFGLGKNISAQYYSWDHQFNAKNDWKGLVFGNSSNSPIKDPTLFTAIDFIRLGDPISFYFGLFGIIIILFFKKEYHTYLILFLLSILFILPFLASIILLQKHYIFLETLLIPISAFGIERLSNKISILFKKSILRIILIIILLISLILLGLPIIPHFYQPNGYHFYGKSHIAQIMEFKEENIPKNALIVADSRIYRGQINWAFQGKPYLEGIDFMNFINNQDKMPGNIIPIDVYFFECIPDDCGWGTVKNQPEFNASIESLTDFFKQNGNLIKTVSEPTERKPYYILFTSQNKEDIINVYKATIPMKDSILIIAQQPKEWFLYTIGYTPKEKQFDYYQTRNLFDKFLDKITHWIVFFALILAFLSPIYIISIINKR